MEVAWCHSELVAGPLGPIRNPLRCTSSQGLHGSKKQAILLVGGFTKKSHDGKTYYILAHYQVPARKRTQCLAQLGLLKLKARGRGCECRGGGGEGRGLGNSTLATSVSGKHGLSVVFSQSCCTTALSHLLPPFLACGEVRTVCHQWRRL